MKFILNCSVTKSLLFVLLMVGFTSLADGCLWDWDTLQMERRRFPCVLETITGKFVRHSPAYYEWRIKDRIQQMRSPAEDPQLADDLAVAYSKLGDHTAGIAVLEEVLAAHPDRYETLANLGTIHMLAGDLKTGKEYIDRAIVINPDAHFGREKYQSLLAEYFTTERKTPHPHFEHLYHMHPKEAVGFAEFVLKKRKLPTSLGERSEEQERKGVEEELRTAQKGVLGMMHFANYDSPLLLEALGDLLTAWPRYEEDAMHLAARAYYRIAQQSDDPKIRAEYERVVEHVLFGNLDYIQWRNKQQEPTEESTDSPSVSEKLITDIAQELNAAKEFALAIESDEKRWIAAGIDVDQAFAEKYYASLENTVEAAKKQLASEWRDVRGNPYQEGVQRFLLMVGAGIVALIGLIWGVRFAIRRRAASNNPVQSH